MIKREWRFTLNLYWLYICMSESFVMFNLPPLKRVGFPLDVIWPFFMTGAMLYLLHDAAYFPYNPLDFKSLDDLPHGKTAKKVIYAALIIIAHTAFLWAHNNNFYQLPGYYWLVMYVQNVTAIWCVYKIRRNNDLKS